MIKIIIDYIIAIPGIILTIIGIIKGIKEIRKTSEFKISKNTQIFLLIGVILLLSILLIKECRPPLPCQNPKIKILQPLKNDSVGNYITVKGNAICFPSNYRIAVLIHNVSRFNNLDKWFINNECACIDNNNNWQLTNIVIGTENTKGNKFEIYAYAIPDSVCNQINRIVDNNTYQGSVTRPQIFQGVFDFVEINRH